MNVRKKASNINIVGLTSGQSDRSVNKHSLGDKSNMSSPRYSNRKVTDALNTPSRISQFSPKKNVKQTAFGKTNKKVTHVGIMINKNEIIQTKKKIDK